MSRRRVGLEVLALVVIAALMIAGPLLSRSHTPNKVATVEVLAERGDSLWTLAQDHPMDGLTTAQTVEVISTINQLGSPLVTTGGTLSVPQAATDMVVASN